MVEPRGLWLVEQRERDPLNGGTATKPQSLTNTPLNATSFGWGSTHSTPQSTGVHCIHDCWLRRPEMKATLRANFIKKRFLPHKQTRIYGRTRGRGIHLPNSASGIPSSSDVGVCRMRCIELVNHDPMHHAQRTHGAQQPSRRCAVEADGACTLRLCCRGQRGGNTWVQIRGTRGRKKTYTRCRSGNNHHADSSNNSVGKGRQSCSFSSKKEYHATG